MPSRPRGQIASGAFLGKRAAWVGPVLWTILGLLIVLEAALLFKASAGTPLNSDHLENVLEVSDILRGNVLLHGWILASDNFYLSDNPFFLLTRLLFGRTLVAIYATPFLVYAVFLAAAAGIVCINACDLRARAVGLAALVFFLGAPSLAGIGAVLFVGGQHIAALIYCVLAWLALDLTQRAGTRRATAGFAAAYTTCAVIALMSDPFTAVVFCLPTLVGLGVALMVAGRRLLQATMLGLTLLALAGARFGLQLIQVLGGFTTQPNQSLHFVGAADFGRNAEGVLFGLLRVSGGYVFGLDLRHPSTVVVLIHAVGLGIILAAMVAALRRALTNLEGWNLRFVLALAVLIDIASCLASHEFTVGLVPTALNGGASIRYLTPVILFGGVLAGLELTSMLRKVKLPAWRGVWVGLCAAAVLASSAMFVAHGFATWRDKPATATDPGRLAGEWLLRRGLTHGVGTYWQGLLITALTSEKVTVLSVVAAGNHLEPYLWITNRTWYRQQPRPQFVIYNPGNEYRVNLGTITATYGPPLSIERVAGYDVALLAPAAGR